NQVTIGPRYRLRDEAWGRMSASVEYYYQSGVWLDTTGLEDPSNSSYEKPFSNINLRFDCANIAGNPVDAGAFVRNATNNVHLIGDGNLLPTLGVTKG